MQERGGGLQIACQYAYIINGRPHITFIFVFLEIRRSMSIFNVLEII